MLARRLSSLFLVLAAWLTLPAVASPATPGPNGRIVFSGPAPNGGYGSELYSVAPDGTGVTRLTFSATFEQAPAWSPDGTQIAFEMFDENDRRRINVISAHGTNERRISPDMFGEDDTSPTWSPDGTQIAFASTRADSFRIWVVNADGTELRRVTSEFSSKPAWGPDGRIAYVAGGQAIAVVNPDGTGRRQVSFPPAGYLDESVSWSPDGNQLVVARREMFGNSPQLFVIDLDDSSERQLTFGVGANRSPSWSPDGTQIAFTHERRLFVIAADGSGMRPLTNDGGEVLGVHWGTSTIVPVPEPPNAPRITIFSPAPRQYPPGEPIGAIYICESDTSFVVQCEGDVPLGAPVETETTGMRTFTVRAMDAEGRTSTASVRFEVVDWRAPTVHVRAPAAGAEYEVGQSVQADFECSDGPGGSGIEICDGELRQGQPLDTSRPGSFTAHFWALDRYRNFTQVAVTYKVVYRDRTAPAITMETPGEGASYVLGTTALASYRCDDEPFGSGVELCEGSVPSGAALDTATVGTRSLSVRARDRAGNASALTRSYRVVYAFSGFFAPLVGLPAMASLDAGDTVPVKFSLSGDHGLGILAPGSPTWSRIDCGSGSPLGDASSARHTLSYLAGTDRYQLRVESDASWAGTCRRLAVRLADGTTHFANVRFG